MSDSQVYEQGPEAAAAKPNTLSRSQSAMGQVCTNCRCLFGVKMTGSFCDDAVPCRGVCEWAFFGICGLYIFSTQAQAHRGKYT
jgi:hypothetical protein